MKHIIQTYISRASFHKSVDEEIYKQIRYHLISDEYVMSQLVNWKSIYIRGMIYIEFDGIVFMDKLDADMIPESWSSFLNVIVDMMDTGIGVETSCEQGFCLSMKRIDSRTIELCNYRGNDYPSIYIYGKPYQLLPPIFDAIHECCEIMGKYITMNAMKEQLRIVRAKADEWMKSFR
ncbi:MAG: hypothetical protein ACK5Z2_08860 [Bacteroidota bacterium]